MAANEALLIIDYTNDFVHDDGALTCGAAGQALESSIIALADQFAADGSWVILPTDVHTPNDPYHPESKLFPPHNVRNTWGREFYGQLKHGSRNTKMMRRFTCMTKRVTVHLPGPTWIFGYANGILIRSTWLGFAPTSVCYTPPLMPTT